MVGMGLVGVSRSGFVLLRVQVEDDLYNTRTVVFNFKIL